MEVSTKEFQNIYGFPTLNANIYKALKRYHLVLGVESIFSPKFVQPKNTITIVIDNFGKLRFSGIPILGYTRTPTMVYVKSKFSASDLVSNKVSVSLPFHLNGAKSSAKPTIPLLLEFNACSTSDHYIALQSKYAVDLKDPDLSKFKWLRRVLNQALKPSEEKDDN